jgi:GNAT superfamily N-acetyltransferase
MARAQGMLNRIRPADLKLDRALLTDLLTGNLNPSAGGPRFDWLYLENPHGLAQAWIAVEGGTGKGVGAAAAFPHKLMVGDSIRLGYVLGDFCIHPQHRSLGLALQLQRACLEQLGLPCSCSTYDFPSERMMAIYRRMQIAPLCRMVRWSKPLRADRKIGELGMPSALARILAAPINKLLEWKDVASVSNGGWTITEHRGNCGEEFTQLAHTVGSRYGTCVERSSEYLNWRYLRHPLVHYEVLTARRGRDLMGYVVFSHSEQDAKIVDLFGFSNTAMWTALVTQVVARLRARAIVTLSVPALATNPWTGVLKERGFYPREQAPVVICRPGSIAAGGDMASPWYLTDGDRES